MLLWGRAGEENMDARTDYCWRKAAEFARRAEETTDNEVRDFFYRLRDSWIRAANHQEAIDSFDGNVAEVLDPPGLAQ
jgi:hypothetical protein